MNRPFHAPTILIAVLAFAALMPACTTQYGMRYNPYGSAPTSPAVGPVSHVAAPRNAGGENGILVRTHDDARFFFQDENWKLTFGGIAGTADITTAEGLEFSADTTLSYWNASSAAAVGRSKSTSQFLLTILGIILIVGLAAIILYAAFLATEW